MYVCFTELTSAALTYGGVQERISTGGRSVQHAAGAFCRPLRYAKTIHHCHAQFAEALNQVMRENMPTTRKRTQWRPREGLLRAAGLFDSYSISKDRALFTFPDACKGQKPTAECLHQQPKLAGVHPGRQSTLAGMRQAGSCCLQGCWLRIAISGELTH